MGQVIPFPAIPFDTSLVPRRELAKLLDTMAGDVGHLLDSLALSDHALGAGVAPAQARAQLEDVADQVRGLAECIDELRGQLPGCDVTAAARQMIELVFEVERMEKDASQALIGALVHDPDRCGTGHPSHR